MIVLIEMKLALLNFRTYSFWTLLTLSILIVQEGCICFIIRESSYWKNYIGELICQSKRLKLLISCAYVK